MYSILLYQNAYDHIRALVGYVGIPIDLLPPNDIAEKNIQREPVRDRV